MAPRSLGSIELTKLKSAVDSEFQANADSFRKDGGASIYGVRHRSHSLAMILRLFSGQLDERERQEHNDVQPLNKLLDRDFGGWKGLKTAYSSLVENEEPECVAFGLSYVDFKFHLFSVNLETGQVPFAFSAVATFPAFDWLLRASDCSRAEFLNGAYNQTNWERVNNRIGCLTEPLELL